MDKQLPKAITLSIALLQGIILWLLYYSFEQQVFPATDPVWFNPLVSISAVIPVLFLVAATPQNWQRLTKFLIGFSAILIMTSAFVGTQQKPIEIIESAGLVFILAITTGIASFKAVMYGQLWSEKSDFSYHKLFDLSWRNFLIGVESALFTGIFYGILGLGAALFHVIGIDVFSELLEKAWFNIPVICMAFGFAIITFRRISKTVDIVANILQTLIKFLLPMLAVVALVFLITLPFTGLEKLWDTGRGSTLLLIMQAVTLFFVNAVYQNRKQHPYPLFWHRFIYISVAVLPIYSMIIAYGLWLRIDQYGWSVGRCWGVVIWALLASFCLGYLQGIVRKKDDWLQSLGWINVRMGIVILFVLLAVNTPILNFQKIAANSQISRISANQSDIENLDTYYFKWNLARPGYLALQEFKSNLDDSQNELVAKINKLYLPKRKEGEQITQEQFVKHLHYWPAKDIFPAALSTSLYKQQTNRWFVLGQQEYYLLAIDLNKDKQKEFLSVKEETEVIEVRIWRKNNENEWISAVVDRIYQSGNSQDKVDIKSIITENNLGVTEPEWQDLMLGNVRMQIPNK
ncbi:DUF4153 domain-containing protein [Thalassotalea sp. PS06]|uniref:DUF4153 domain-containing protein n=1 Tax=Thalassotalea sp. PS06 TaxID=2594005 RepID=UPI0011621759|nr:DUF4153 domain-containing protein [Thalassotalea sp. PS06]QDP00404.1 DUF4153 domain-containing protein [Thalassotalea sp. PS06]